MARRKRKTTRRIRRRRNPALSAATKRKISAALKRRNRSKTKTTRRRPAAKARTKVRTRTKVVTKYRTRRPASRRRRVSRRSGSRGIRINFKSILAKDVIKTAGGAVGSALITNLVINRFGHVLPGTNTVLGQVAYSLAIPVTGAILVNKAKLDKKIAEGMIIGGVILAINRGIDILYSKGMIPADVVGTGAYLPSQDEPVHQVSAGGDYRALRAPGYDAIDSFGAPSDLYSSESAFVDSAWN